MQMSQFDAGNVSEVSSVPPSSDIGGSSEMGDNSTDPRVSAIYRHYEEQSTATELLMAVNPPVALQVGTGTGTLVIPGWVRERAAEMLFDGGDIDEQSIVETTLECLRKVSF